MESARINNRNILCVSKTIQNKVGEVYVVLSYIIGAIFKAEICLSYGRVKGGV